MQSKEWLYHIEKWLKEKDACLYRPIGEAEFDYYITDSLLPYEEAVQCPFTTIAPGAQWGDKWLYGWFRGSFELPADAAGKRIEVQLNLGAESTVYVNGRLAGAKDDRHPSLTLTRSAAVGDSFDIVAEAYAGHDRDLPVYRHARLVAVNEELYQFFIDLKVLLQLRNGLAPGSLRVSEIDAGFLKLISALDWNEAASAPEEFALAGRCILKPLLDCVNGSTAPKLFMMGQSHLDIAWLWPIEETKRKIARTFSNQLALLDEYPEYRYMQSQPYLFQLAKELHPELYGRIKQYVTEGRIIPEGGAWVEPDTNIPGGESLVRQFLYGKRFFREEFGAESEMLWLPDVFGYSGNLPQIMRKCGIRYFASVKMYQTYDNIVDPFPYNTFTWEGIDGSSVPVHLLDYGPFPNPADVSYALFQWNERIQKTGISTRLVQFGYGDGGGGANRDDLEFLRRMGDLEGVPRTAISAPREYFEDLEQRGMPDSHYVGELYYPAHRGTLTSQAKMKQGNRRGEFTLREAETWNTLAALGGRASYPKTELDAAWLKLLLLQFHDILPGTSITRVHEEAEREFDELLHSASGLVRQAVSALTEGSGTGEGITFFNSLPWERAAVVELPDNWEHARYAAGEQSAQNGPLYVQPQQDQRYARVTLPAMGCISLELAGSEPETAVEADASTTGVKATAGSLENEHLRIMLNERGELTSIWDKDTESEWAKGLCSQFLMFRDQPSNFDAWEIDRRYAAAELALPESASITVLAEGPLYAAVRVERVLNQSTVIQEIRLETGSRRVEFRTRVDWREKHKLLKVGFDVNLHSHEVLSEIQFGFARRPNHLSRPHDADRYEVSQHKWSALVEGNRCFSLLNDGKYGLNAEGSRMNLTLLRAPSWPDERADEGMHEFSYALHVWNEGFMSSPAIREAYELNAPVLSASGIAEPSAGFASCDRDNIIIDTVKLAEDGSGDLVLRLYEAKGASISSRLRLGFDIISASETDMLEECVIADLQDSIDNREIALSFTPFEVKTVRCSLQA